jgi:hypothetical protein
MTVLSCYNYKRHQGCKKLKLAEGLFTQAKTSPIFKIRNFHIFGEIFKKSVSLLKLDQLWVPVQKRIIISK